jgi:TolB protein
VGDLPLLPTAFSGKVSPDETLVAFLREPSHQLWLANSDGSNERLLAEIEVFSFEWSPDGKRIAYTSLGTNTVHVLDVDDLEDQQLSVPEGHYRISGWSPDGSKLTAVSAGELIVINVATGESAFLDGDLDPYSSQRSLPAWSPDGSMLLYLVRDASDLTHIVVVDAESGQRRQLADVPLRDLDPAWSPDGESIAFWRQLNTDASYLENGLYVVSVESGKELELARFRLRGSSLDNLPAWSPDGERIAAFAQSLEAPGIYVVDVEEAEVTHVIATSDGRGYAGIAWSEDGKQILLESSYQGI